jgi:hypothetical protein
MLTASAPSSGVPGLSPGGRPASNCASTRSGCKAVASKLLLGFRWMGCAEAWAGSDNGLMNLVLLEPSWMQAADNGKQDPLHGNVDAIWVGRPGAAKWVNSCL